MYHKDAIKLGTNKYMIIMKTNELIRRTNEFLSSVEVKDGYTIFDYITVNESTLLTIRESDTHFCYIREMLEDKNAFDTEIIYYSTAIAFLSENDPSLRDSLELASDIGYAPKDLSSEILATLLATDMCRNEFNSKEDEINEFFTELFES